jgi:hypothetical protein
VDVPLLIDEMIDHEKREKMRWKRMKKMKKSAIQNRRLKTEEFSLWPLAAIFLWPIDTLLQE